VYSFEYVVKNLKLGEEATCVHGQLKGFVIAMLSDGLDMEEPDGVSYGLIVREKDFYELRDTEWIIEKVE